MEINGVRLMSCVCLIFRLSFFASLKVKEKYANNVFGIEICLDLSLSMDFMLCVLFLPHFSALIHLCRKICRFRSRRMFAWACWCGVVWCGAIHSKNQQHKFTWVLLLILIVSVFCISSISIFNFSHGILRILIRLFVVAVVVVWAVCYLMILLNVTFNLNT